MCWGLALCYCHLAALYKQGHNETIGGVTDDLLADPFGDGKHSFTVFKSYLVATVAVTEPFYQPLIPATVMFSPQ